MKKSKEVIKIKKNKVFFVIIFCTGMVLNCTNIYAKYVMQNEFNIANVSIDRTRPKIELISIQNSDENFKNYANKTHVVVAKIKVIDKNLESVNLDENHFKIKAGDKFINDVSFECGQVQELEDGKIVEIQLSNLNVNGMLKLVFTEGFAEDDGKLNNVNTEISTDVVVDNSIPFVPVERDEFVFDGGDGAGSELNLG